MKKSSKELQKDLDDVYKQLNWLREHYPMYRKDKYWVHNPLPHEILEEYRFLWHRIDNLKININQATWKEFGIDVRKRRYTECR